MASLSRDSFCSEFLLHFVPSSHGLSSPLTVSHTTNPARRPPPLPAIPFSSVHLCTALYSLYSILYTVYRLYSRQLTPAGSPASDKAPLPPCSSTPAPTFPLSLSLSVCTGVECGVQNREQRGENQTQSVRRQRIIVSCVSQSVSQSV